MITRTPDRWVYQTHDHEPERSNRRDALSTFGFLIPVNTTITWAGFAALIRLHYVDARSLAMASLVESF